MHLVDWAIIIILFIGLNLVGWYCKRYVKSVADFLVAGRNAGRYLGLTASSMAGLGAITIIAFFELYYLAGFAGSWWGITALPIGVFIALTGWGVYRFRKTRVMTMAEMFERRYSRKFRIFCGFLAFVSGIINFGIFPACGARFFMYFCGFPEYIYLFGLPVSVYLLIMIILVGTSLLFCLLGGQVTLIVTDFIQGVFLNIVLVIIAYIILAKFDWSQITGAYLMAENGEALLHPFRMKGVSQFNIVFFVIQGFFLFYNVLSWNPSAVQNCSTKSAHEAKMMAVMNVFKNMGLWLGISLMAIGAYTFMHHPDFASQAAQVKDVLATVGNEEIRSQMTVPAALQHILPVGIIGAFAVVVLFAFISTHDTYLLSWGSVLIQDVIVPIRGKPLPQKQHLTWLRISAVGVAFFIILFSWFFKQTDHILMFMNITGAIYTGGAGAVILGALYWKRATAKGAWAAMIFGCLLSVAAIVYRPYIWPIIQSHIQHEGTLHVAEYISNINGNTMAFIASVISIAIYIIVSLLDSAKPFNLSKLLKREKRDETKPEFSRGDKWLYSIVIAYTAIYLAAFIFVTIYNMFYTVSTETWCVYWHFSIYLSITLGTIVLIWFTIGGLLDLRRLFKGLETEQVDTKDDGFVEDDEK
jgi:SSS family solute:Na+ symporter